MVPSLPSQPSLVDFVQVLEQWAEPPPGQSPWFEAPPAATETLCLSVIRDDRTIQDRSYRRTLTENQAATLIGWLCLAGTNKYRVAIIGRNQANGQHLLANAAIIASRYMEEFWQPLLHDDHTGERFTEWRRDYITQWTRDRLRPSTGPAVTVSSTRATGHFDGILFVEHAARCRLRPFGRPLLRFRWRAQAGPEQPRG